MRILVVGSGAREHALAWKLAQGRGVERVWVAPGNGGTHDNVPLDPMDSQGIERFCRAHGVDLVVVGPEGPLVAGLSDHLAAAGIPVFGPGREAARLEGSKVWAKEFMRRHGVSTAPFQVCGPHDDPLPFIHAMGGRVAVKYDGLAAGKGVRVCGSVEDALEAVDDLRRTFGPSASFVVEQRLEGRELSIIGVTDGTTFALMPPSRDHKRLLDGDEGPNTGGMGAFAPVPSCTPEVLEEIGRRIVEPTFRGLREEGISYRGALYFGIMITGAGPFLLEYNVRFGDPEAQVILPLLDEDLAQVLASCARGRLPSAHLRTASGYAVGVVLASQGYPGSPVTGLPIAGLDRIPDHVLVFHAGTRRTPSGILTAGGRVCTVVGLGPTLEEAAQRAYDVVDRVRFDHRHFRTDIGRGAP